ncbi:BppU family phage baseplate upper protein [Staphylococcus epidermidis]|uniref:BppU family phage baseplate upper protein n=1 Tax=Staphylococcus epidermidis TaxID=1282 RepID=UPI00187ABB8A|nr:BppU family phage baseplate upper protein [Staphylococcus epidermidis]MBE7359869.1 BppU family phage baseplate upper protein [Staphylococcus epidermidis]
MYNKAGDVKLELTSQKREPLNTNIVFYNTDKGTATLNFMLIENDLPLMVSSKNTYTFLILKTSPQHYIVDDVEYTDPINGRVSYTIPNDFLSVPGKVHGQLYIGIRGTEDVLTEVDFYFEIKDAVINTIPTVDKIQSIKTFAELEKNIALRVEEIEGFLKNSEESYNELKSQLEIGINQITSAKEKAVESISSSEESAALNINELKTETLNELNTSKQEIMQSINSIDKTDTSNWQKFALTDTNGNSIPIDNFDFNNPLAKISGSGYYFLNSYSNGPKDITDTGYLHANFSDSNNSKMIFSPSNSNDFYVKSNNYDNDWKKVAFTETSRKWLGTLDGDIFKLKAGLYECYISNNKKGTNLPKTDNTLDYNAYIDVYDTMNGKMVELYDLKNNQKYRGVYEERNNVLSWKKEYSYDDNIQPFYETDWINFQLENGVQDRFVDDGSERLYQNQYKVVKIFNMTQVFFRININNLVDAINNDNTVGRIPSKLVRDSQTFYIRTSIARSPAICTIKVDGTVKVYVNSNDKLNWTNDDYAIGSSSWILDSNDYFVKKPESIYIEGEAPEDLDGTNYSPNMTEEPRNEDDYGTNLL